MNSTKKRFSLLKFISLWLLIILILLLSSFSVYYYNTRLVIMNETFDIKVENIKTISNNSIKNFLWNCNEKSLNEVADALFVDEDLQMLKIYNEKDSLVVQKRKVLGKENGNQIQQENYSVVFKEYLIKNNVKIGKIEAVFSKKKYYNSLYSSLIFFLIFSLILLVSLTFLASIFIEKIIIKAITSLANSAQIIANGELDSKIENNSFIEINYLIENFIKMQVSLKKMMNENSNLVTNLESKIKERTEIIIQAYVKVEEKSNKISFLLDHLEEGIFQINSDLKVDAEFSKYCLDLFGEDITGKKISELFNENDSAKSIFLDDILGDILNGKDIEKRDIFITLLPQEIQIKKNFLKISYIYVFDSESKLLVFVKDISKAKILKREKEKESKKLNMLIKVITGYDDFIALINEYSLFFEDLKKQESEFDISDFFLRIHTFKGSFSQYGMDNIVNFLHKQEDFCQRAVENKETSDIDFRSFFNPENFQIQLKNNLKYIREILGANYLINEPKYEITKSELDLMGSRCKFFLSDIESFWVNIELDRIKLRSFNKMFYPYIEYLQNISFKIGKKVYGLKIKGGDFLINPEILEPLVRSFVHILRNSIVHGIEFPDDRVDKSKKEIGSVTITLNRDLIRNCLLLVISDDGAGLDLTKIKTKIVKMGLELDNFRTETELINSVFLENMSTSEDIDFFSGRGVGLSAVKNEVEKLNGKIEITSKKDYGTKFKFFIPYYFEDEFVIDDSVEPNDFFSQVMSNFREFFNIKSEDIAIKKDRSVEFTEKYLLKYRIKGIFNFEIYISISKEFLKSLDKDSTEDLRNDFLKENLNIIISKSIQVYKMYKYVSFTLDSIVTIEKSLNFNFKNEIIIYQNKLGVSNFKIVFK